MRIHRASRIATLGLALGASLPLAAATSEVTPQSYLVTHRAEVAASPAAVYTALGQVGRWWNGQHTYSGRPENLTVDLRAGGCFCEHWDGNSVEHARVIYAARDKALRLEGGLGPLQDMAVTAIMNYAIASSDGKTTLTFTYRVRGAEASLDKTAAIVDKVTGEQFGRLVAYLERR
jgi:uncharacterized protein YndB with AHSA1/START domain